MIGLHNNGYQSITRSAPGRMNNPTPGVW